MSIRIKICGVTRFEDAAAAVDAGADMIGLNCWPRSPRYIPIERGVQIARAFRYGIDVVAVFVNPTVDEVLSTLDRLGTSTVQLHGVETADFVRSLGDVPVIKAFSIGERADIERLAGFPAATYLLDARDVDLPGGTGRTLDWTLAREAAQYGRILLAGGLTPDNVAEAVRTAQPWGVDSASGTEESPGIKDRRKIEMFVKNARAAAGK